MGRSSAFLIFFFVISVVLINKEMEATQHDHQLGCTCPAAETTHCSDDGPPIRFPFSLNLQHQGCGCTYPPGFQLSCADQNDTVLQLPYSGKFFVTEIDYVSQLLYLSDPDGCTFGRLLLHLNLSSTPFSLPYENDPNLSFNYTFLNCSSTNKEIESDYFQHIDCLSVNGKYQVYVVPSYDWLDDLPLSSCTAGKTVVLPYYLYSGFARHRHQVIVLSWSSPNCGRCEDTGQGCRWKNSTGPDHDNECFYVPHPAKERAIKLVVAGSTVGLVLLIGLMMVAKRHYNTCHLDKFEKENQSKIEKFLEDYKSLKPTRYTYADLKRITNQFKIKLGEGGYGTVFKGILSNEIPVAVKILNNAKGNGEEFINEVGTIGTIHHVNIVRLFGFCADGFRRALVYEFLPNESLEKFIFSRDSKTPFLGWPKLQDIAIGIAKGIEYLHQGCDQRILHFDIKPHNILLDYNLNPKISDFGLAKLCSKENSAVSMSAARGTMGYIAPEVVSRNFGNVSHKSDVYSFGMMLLEMVGGRKNIDAQVEKTSQVYYPEWIYSRINKAEDLEIKVETEGDEKIAMKLSIVGLWCIQWYPVDRPSMKAVVQMLEGETESLVIPPSPFASTSAEKTTRNIHDKPGAHILTVISEQDELE